MQKIDIMSGEDKPEARSAPPLPEDGTLKAAPAPVEPAAEAKPRPDADPGQPDVDEPADDEPVADAAAPSVPAEPPKPVVSRSPRGFWRHKKLIALAVVVAAVAAVAAVPATRYPLLALVLKRSYSVTVTDAKTGTPVSGATLTLAGATTTTDSSGQAKLTAKVGPGTLTITKQYYETMHDAVFVGVSTGHNHASIQLNATGRQVSIKVLNKITGKPVADASIKVLDTDAKTDASGQATIVLPTTAVTQTATLTASGYNQLKANVTVTDRIVDANTFKVVPSGRVYFLSNLSGNIDVVSTNLDGSGRMTVLAGTGSEDVNNTILLASRDWQYLALLSKRDSNGAKLYLIDTATDKLTTIDDSVANFSLIGWSGHYFVYDETLTSVPVWQSGAVLVKSFNADTATLKTLDQSAAAGTQASPARHQYLSAAKLVNDRLVYGFTWDSDGQSIAGQKNVIISTNVDGTNKSGLLTTTIPSGADYTGLDSVLYQPGQLYIEAWMTSKNPNYYIYQYSNNSITQSNTLTATTYQQAQDKQTTYLLSPSGRSTFWTQIRDGKNTLFVGDADGQSGTQIASLSDYSPYGWYTDNYLLVQKSGSELYIMPVDGGTPLKLSDYYKPAYNFYGYGGGYGGL